MPDGVVIGAGPNGLVAANLLADAGWDVVVLEASDDPGGAVRTGELTVDGFRHDLFSAFYPLAAASPAIGGLHLEEHGLRWCRAPLALAHPLPDGRCAELSNDLEVTVRSLDALSPGDGAAWRRMIEEWEAIEGAFLGAIFDPFPPIRSAARLARTLGLLGSGRLARHALLPVRRMTEELFTGEGARLLIGGCALHTDLSPEAAGSGVYGWLLCCLAQRVGFPVPEGGAGSLTSALVSRLESLGGAVRCRTPVTEVVVRSGRAAAARTADGELVEARRAIVADVPAPTLYGNLLSPRHLPASLLDDLRNFQWDMGTVKVDWALDGPIPWTASRAGSSGTVHLADDFDNLTEFAAEIAMGRLPSRPFLIVGQQSIADPTRSPEGTETAWAYTHVPRHVRRDARGEIDLGHGVDAGEEDAAEKSWLDAFVERVEGRVEEYAPGFSGKVLGRHVFSPASMWATNPSLVGGAIGGGTSQLHQQLVFRPVPGTGRPETPIAGLYLASASAHPGGGVHGIGGANAARAAVVAFPRLRSRILGRGGLSRRSGGKGRDGSNDEGRTPQ